ncbi:MAG: 2Fe-2S iron-sulfur cluster binding domain-containing protein [Bdellovibrionales bacterium]|nr:2Fe-2S iron-sulfur cluster binding domain-containing protein [Bdellovibrionales bacterium]
MKVSLPQLSKELEFGAEPDLRKFLRKNAPGFLYQKPMNWVHCRGMGTCGTCAVKVKGKCTEPTAVEKWRLNFPPHKNGLEQGLRLACQCKPLEEISVEKLEGLWGQGSGL